jgi:hypothetical protein
MAGGSYTVTLKERTITVTRQDLAMFRELYLGTSELTSRMSELIWLDMYTMDAAFGVSPHDIVRVIQELEGNAPGSGIKPATRFRRMPLKGLWHKHFFSAHFVPNNILLGFGTNGLRKLVNEAKSPVITQEMITELAWRIAEEPFKEREAAKKLTGEWIIYLPHDGKKYYLCCSTHEAEDQSIYDRIMEHCVRDFPALPAWLKAEQNS